MKWRKFLSSFFYLFMSLFLIYSGCSSTSNLKMTKSLPPIVKEYKHITLYGNRPGMMDTGIYLREGDPFSILATGSIDRNSLKNPIVKPEDGWPLMVRIGKRNQRFRPLRGVRGNATRTTSLYSGNLYLGIHDGSPDQYGEPTNWRSFNNNTGYFSVDIIVWEKEDWAQIVDFFEEMKQRGPENKAVVDALNQANYLKEIYLGSEMASKEIEETKKEIQELKVEADKVEAVAGKNGAEDKGFPKEAGIKTIPEEKPSPEEVAVKAVPEKKPTPRTNPSAIDVEGQEKIALLEEKLTKLVETLSQLEEMKKNLEEERKRTDLLAQELEEKEEREKDLLAELEQGLKTPPVIVIASPKDESKVEVNTIQLSGVAEDEGGLARLEIFINNKPLKKKRTDRGIRVIGERNLKRFDFRERIPLEGGLNRIKIRAVDADGLFSEKILTIHHVKRQKNIWAVVIGINTYPNIRQLKYAVNDARIIYDYLVNFNHIPAENVVLLLDQEATLTRLRSTLGTHLKNKAGKDDMVIIFFAGHGATEKDVMSPDGDGLEKYLLPYDADTKDLYASALPMREISHIFNRIRSERLVFIADSCYSGASGGRTIGITGIRANISEAYLDRITKGKGRVIMTASGANEVSEENDKLQNGVFTYFLVEGLKGKADADKDGLITVDEVYRYVSEHVPKATGQEQHPVMKGTVEGRLILGVIE